MSDKSESAASIDGATPFKISCRIFVTLSGAIIAAIPVLVFLASWNDLLGPIVYLASVGNYAIPVGLNCFYGTGGSLYRSSYSGGGIVAVPKSASSSLHRRAVLLRETRRSDRANRLACVRPEISGRSGTGRPGTQTHCGLLSRYAYFNGRHCACIRPDLKAGDGLAEM